MMKAVAPGRKMSTASDLKEYVLLALVHELKNACCTELFIFSYFVSQFFLQFVQVVFEVVP